MSYLLHIETATRNCSVAVSRDAQVISLCEVAEDGYAHAEKLHVFIEKALADAGIRYQDLNAISVSQGPGSYTGLRIGVSAAKGLCYALGIPLIAVDTLAVLAEQIQINDGLIVPMLDARRMEVYSAVFDSNHQWVRGVEAQIIDADSFDQLGGKVYFAGDAQEKCKTVLTRGDFVFVESAEFPSAQELAKLAFQKFEQNKTVDVAYFEPYYLKDFIAGKKL